PREQDFPPNISKSDCRDFAQTWWSCKLAGNLPKASLTIVPLRFSPTYPPLGKSCTPGGNVTGPFLNFPKYSANARLAPPADDSAGMTDVGSATQRPATSALPGPANFRDHPVRLKNWRRRYCLRRSMQAPSQQFLNRPGISFRLRDALHHSLSPSAVARVERLADGRYLPDAPNAFEAAKAKSPFLWGIVDGGGRGWSRVKTG